MILSSLATSISRLMGPIERLFQTPMGRSFQYKFRIIFTLPICFKAEKIQTNVLDFSPTDRKEHKESCNVSAQ